MKIIGYRMRTPGSTRGAVTDQFHRWIAGQVYSCPAVPVGEFAHIDPANCETLKGDAAPEVQTASIDPNEIETRPVTAKKRAAKSK
jgi:hypothetical protein